MQNVSIEKVELHYFFNDGLHQMDASVRHRCEGELLKILGEISSILHVQIKPQTEAYAEGGLKEVWTFVKNNKVIIGVITAVLINVLSDQINVDREMVNLQKEKLRLEIQEKRLNLHKMKKEIEHGNEKLNDSISENLVFILNNDYKAIRARSEFYKSLLSYQRVTQISGQILDHNNYPVSEQIFVEREKFSNFILSTDELPKEIDDNAVIEVISPVLKKGKYKWRGVYNGTSIDFYMKDGIFKDSIFHQQVAFKNGVSLKCVLEICPKINEVGEVYVPNYSVLTVVSYHFGDEKIETGQGKKYFRDKKELASQLPLFEE